MKTTRPASKQNRQSLHREAQNVRRDLRKRLANSDLTRSRRKLIISEMENLRDIQRRAAEDISWSASQMLRGQLSDAASRARSLLD